MSDETAFDENRDLSLELVLGAPRHAVWRCWTEPELLKQWFTPKPWKTVGADLDVRAGGRCNIVMESPEGEQNPNVGVYLEVVPNERLVTTDAFTEGWKPSERPFMTAILTFSDTQGGGTLYRAHVRHFTTEAKEQHEQMGFEAGWTQAAKQLESVATSIATEKDQ